jgi:hypothetical protein
VTAIALVLTAAHAPGCGTPGRNLRVDVGPAPEHTPTVRMGEEIGRLLSPDPEVSRAAEQRLIALDLAGRDRLVAHAATLEGERDVRLLNVLDEHHALPDMPPQALLDFLLWKARRPERFYVMKAQSRLLDMARTEPDAMLVRLAGGGPDFGILAVVLGLAGRREAMAVLLERYRHTTSDRERAAAAEALGQLAGAALRPRPRGSARDIARDADALEDWYERTREQAVGAAAGGGDG